MIWHIFKKDWKLLWPVVAVIAALHIMNATIWLMMGHFELYPGLFAISRLLPYAVILGMAALIVMSVHQEALPGDRQDWLVRPIRRRDLILAKLLFVLIAVHVPMLLADLAQGVATGFSFSDSLASALSRGGFLLLSLSLPVLALATMASTVVEVIWGALALALIFVGVTLAIQAGFGSAAFSATHSGMFWMQQALWFAVLLVAAIAVMSLQYFRRATMLARGVALGAVLLALGVFTFVPWATAFAFQQWLSPSPAAAQPIALTFDPGIGRIITEAGGLVKIDSFSGTTAVARRANSVWLPVRVSGLPPESLVITDRADVRIIGRDGAILFRGRTTGDPQTTDNPGNIYSPGNTAANPIDDFPLRTSTGGDVRTHQLITLPDKIYELARTQPVLMELDYSLTLFRIKDADTITALNGDKRMANGGWCKTRIDYNYGRIEMGCLNPGVDGMRRGINCFTAVLENPVSGERNPARSFCYLDYRPYGKFIPDKYIPSAVDQSVMRMNFRDPQGLTKYPVDGSQLAEAQVLYKSFQPIAHFTRHLAIPNTRLGDWEADTDKAGDP